MNKLKVYYLSRAGGGFSYLKCNLLDLKVPNFKNIGLQQAIFSLFLHNYVAVEYNPSNTRTLTFSDKSRQAGAERR